MSPLPTTRLCRMVVKSPQINRSVTFYDGAHGLADMLGFKRDEVHLRHIGNRVDDVPSAIARYPVDMTGGFNGIYVYSDIVEHQFVGDNMAPLLRVIQADRQSGKNIYHIYEKPYYLPVTRQRIDTIEISLRIDFGETLIFESRRVLVKLHFKRVSD